MKSGIYFKFPLIENSDFNNIFFLHVKTEFYQGLPNSNR